MRKGREGGTVVSVSVAGIGVLLLAVGVVGGPLGWDVGGVAPFLIVGAVLLVVAIVHDRVSEVQFQAAGVSLGLLLSKVESQSSRAIVKELERLGVADLTAAYEFVHAEMKQFDDLLFASPPPERVSNLRVILQDQLVEQARDRAEEVEERGDPGPDKKLLNRALTSDSEAGRAIALGVGKAYPNLITLGTLERNIRESLSANEQFHALLLANDKLGNLNARQRRRLRHIIEDELHSERSYIAEDSDRRSRAESILERIRSQER
jgi:hypothetical protein